MTTFDNLLLWHPSCQLDPCVNSGDQSVLELTGFSRAGNKRQCVDGLLSTLSDHTSLDQKFTTGCKQTDVPR